MIDQDLFDRSFVRDWSNGPFLVREDNGRLLSGADLDESGNSTARVAWDKTADAPVLYDNASGSYERTGADLALGGTIDVPGRAGTSPTVLRYWDPIPVEGAKSNCCASCCSGP